MERNSDETEGMKADDDDSPFVPERGFYQPSTEDTWEAYQALLCIVEQQLGGYSTSVLCGVAHEVLSVLKCQNIKNLLDKRAEIEKILNRLPDHTFEQLLESSGCITDFFRGDRYDRLIGEEIKDGRDSLFVPEEGFYQPRTEETWMAYKLLLDVIRSQIGHDQPDVILCMIAHEVLQILKNEQFGPLETRKRMLENLLNWISDDNFNRLVFVGGIIQDFQDRRLGNNGVPSRVGPAFAANTDRTVDFDQSTQNPWSDGGSPLEWEPENPSQQPELSNHDQMAWNAYDDHDVVDESDPDNLSRRLSQLTTDDLGDDTVFDDVLDHSEGGGDGDGDDDDGEAQEEEEDDDDDDDDGAQEDDDFVVVEEGEDWVMVDSATP